MSDLYKFKTRSSCINRMLMLLEARDMEANNMSLYKTWLLVVLYSALNVFIPCVQRDFWAVSAS